MRSPSSEPVQLLSPATRRSQLALLARVEVLLAPVRPIADAPASDSLFAGACTALGFGTKLQDALAIVAAPHLDPAIRDVIEKHRGQRHVDAALLLRVGCETREERLAVSALYRDDGPLHRAGLVESTPDPHRGALEAEIVPTPRLMHLLAGRVGLDHRLERLATLIPASADGAIGIAPPERVNELGRRVATGHVIISGAAGSGKLRLASALADAIVKRAMLVVESAYLTPDPQRLPRVLSTLALEAESFDAVLVLRRIENLVENSRVAAIVKLALAKLHGRVWLTTDIDLERCEAPHLIDLAPVRVFLPHPDTELREAAWRYELDRAGIVVDAAATRTLASEYPLPRTAIETVARLATFDADLPKLAESQMRGQLARFARKSRNRARLDDLVLADNTRDQVLEVLSAVRHRAVVFDRWGLAARHASGRGIVAMFNGPPGTGKTLAANVIANELELPLFRIDVSQIVDRYVGETEKNLMAMFDEAAACRAALLFDEADSLFGKRIDAKDATDRFANMQINLLLNLIEDYDGFVVLTTNLKQALDGAFMRRIAYKVTFDLPERAERRALWDHHLPPSIPRHADVDLEELAAEFEAIGGGDIKNVVLRAALSAGGKPVSQQMLRRSMINELRANGAVVSDRGGLS